MTLGQAAWALMFVIIYVAGATGAILALNLTGVIEFTLEPLLPVFLATITAAVFLALYVHLFRRNKLTPADLGFRRPTRRLFHLFWQIPLIIIACTCVQGLFLGLLGLLNVDTSTAGSSNGLFAEIGSLSAPSAVITVLVIAVLTPLWEEILFRGAILDGLSRRFRPAIAITLSAALFAGAHLIPLNFIYLFTVGIALALLRRFHQNLWAPVILHTANNGLVAFLAISFVQSGS